MPHTISAFGQTWRLRHHIDVPFGPGPNFWDKDNIECRDGEVLLHLRTRSGRWTCAEIVSEEPLHYGTYTWQIEGPIDQLDENVVFGLFHYPTPDVGPDNTHQISIEVAKFPLLNESMLVYGVCSSETPDDRTQQAHQMHLEGTATTHQYKWIPNSVQFRSWHGHGSPEELTMSQWAYKPAKRIVAPHPMPLHISLWLFQAKEPTDGQEVSIAIKDFNYEPRRILLWEETLQKFQREYLIDLLEEAEGRIKGPGGAAEISGVKAPTIYSWMKKFDIPEKS